MGKQIVMYLKMVEGEENRYHQAVEGEPFRGHTFRKAPDGSWEFKLPKGRWGPLGKCEVIIAQ